MKNFLFIVSIALITVVGVSGCGGGETGTDRVDIRKVIANPETYAGKTLASLVIIDLDWGAYDCFRGVGVSGGEPLRLDLSPSLKEKVVRTFDAVGKFQAVVIKYRVYERSTLTKIRTYTTVWGQVEERSARKRQLEGIRDETIDPMQIPESGTWVRVSDEEWAKVCAKERLEAIAEIKRIEEIEATESKLEVPLDSNGVPLNWLQNIEYLNCSGVFLDIWIP